MFNAATLTTLLRYALQALGGWLVASGKLDAGNWETISGALLVLLPAVAGAFAANADKVVVNGKTVALKNLPPSTQDAVTASAASSEKKASILENLLGIFLRKH